MSWPGSEPGDIAGKDHFGIKQLLCLAAVCKLRGEYENDWLAKVNAEIDRLRPPLALDAVIYFRTTRSMIEEPKLLIKTAIGDGLISSPSLIILVMNYILLFKQGHLKGLQDEEMRLAKVINNNLGHVKNQPFVKFLGTQMYGREKIRDMLISKSSTFRYPPTQTAAAASVIAEPDDKLIMEVLKSSTSNFGENSLLKAKL